MLVYHFLSSEYAIQNLQNRRLKVSLLDNLNDPFDHLPFRVKHESKEKLEDVPKVLAQNAHVLCFSEHFSNPLMWSHYADKHQGVCLAFEVPNKYLNRVNYVCNRLNLDIEREAEQPEGITTETVMKIYTTKFADWNYEEEQRMFVKPEEVIHEVIDGKDLQFFPFGEELTLKGVYLGLRCDKTQQDIYSVLQTQEQQVKIYKMQLAPSKFKMKIVPL